MVDKSADIRAKSQTFFSNLKSTDFIIKSTTKAFLLESESSVFCLEATDVDVTRLLLAQVLISLKKEAIFKDNLNEIIFTDFSSFTTMLPEENQNWLKNFPDLLVCKLDKEEQFDILKSWVDIVEDKSKKIMFIVKDSEKLQRNMIKIGKANIFELKLKKLWKENEIKLNNEVICEVENNEANSNVLLNNESTSARALDEDTNVNIAEESNEKPSLDSKVTNNDANLVNLLQTLGIEELDAVDNDGNTQLHLAASDGKMQIVESLLTHNPKKDIKNEFGETALHLAVEKGHNAIVQMLLEHVFNVNATNIFQRTSLHYACYNHNDAHLIEILLKFGAEIKRQDENGQTALHLASYWGHSAVVNSLLKHGANINAQDKYGDSPLHKASLNNKQEIVLILLKHGADLNIKNNQQQNALGKARICKHTNIIQIFENYLITKKLILSKS